MKKIIIFCITLFCFWNSFSQKGPLKGSGKTVNRILTYNNFSKIEFFDLDGKLEVAIGKDFSINVEIDDNLENLFDANQQEQTLSLRLKGNYENRKYIEDTKIKIRITVPSLNEIQHRGNSSLLVTGITGEKFSLKNTGNGTALLNGNVGTLEVICRGNGNVNAQNIVADKVEVRRSGNGNVYTNAPKIITKENTGNGELITIDSFTKKAKSVFTENHLTVAIKNETGKTVNLSVKYPMKGNYGIRVQPFETLTEHFPVGTKIYKGKHINALKKPLFLVKDQTILTIQ